MSELLILSGLDAGDIFELKDGISYIGRDEDNDIRIKDMTVSRRHLRIVRKEDRYFITDLESRNGTFFDGKYLTPGIEVEVRQGTTIAIGMSMLCIGKGCLEHAMHFLDLDMVAKDPGEQGGILVDRREKTNRKNQELLYKISDIFRENLPKRETAQKVLDHILDLFKRIDRAAFVLLDSRTKEIREIVFSSRKPTDDVSAAFCRDVVNRVIEYGKAVLVRDAHTEKEDEGLADTLEALRIESVLCLPLTSTSEIIGALYVDSLERPYGFRRDDFCFLTDVSQRTAMAIEHV